MISTSPFFSASRVSAASFAGTSRDRRRAYVNEAPKMLDFIIEQGIEMERTAEYWPDYYDELPGGCKTSRCVTAKYFNRSKSVV